MIYHLTWLFIIGSFSGFILETILHLIVHKKLVNKQGLWYGLLKPIYGIGLILITLFLYKIRYSNIMHIFIISIIIGTIFEYLCFTFQEKVFKTKTWSYKGISEKVCLPFSFCWGILGTIWIKYLFPIYTKLFNKLNTNIFKIITILIFIFLIYDIILTFLIVYNYSNKKHGKEYNINLMNKYKESSIKKKFTTLSLIK